MGFAFEIESATRTGLGNALLNGKLEMSSLLVGDLVYVGYNMSTNKLMRIRSIKKDYCPVPAITTLKEEALIEVENEDGTEINLSEIAPGMSLINSKDVSDTLKDKRIETIFNLCKKYEEEIICCDNAKMEYLFGNSEKVLCLDKLILAGLYVNDYCIAAFSADDLIVSEIHSGVYKHIPYDKIIEVYYEDRKIKIRTDNEKKAIDSEYILSKNFINLISEIRDTYFAENSCFKYEDVDTKPDNGEKHKKEKRKTKIGYIPSIKGNYGLSGKYDRKKFEDKKAMNNYKDSYFDGNKTATDEYTGKTLHADSQRAKNKYGANKYTSHTPETDHIVPLKRAYEDNKKSICGNLITDEQLSKIVNNSDNFAVTNAHTNRSMGAKSKDSYVNNSGEKGIQDNSKKIVDIASSAEQGIKEKVRTQAMKNVGGEAGIAAAEAAVFAAPGIIYDNYNAVKNGEKTKGEAVRDSLKDVGKEGIKGGGIAVAQMLLEAAISRILG